MSESRHGIFHECIAGFAAKDDQPGGVHTPILRCLEVKVKYQIITVGVLSLGYDCILLIENIIVFDV